jgi:hypothetical protein
MINYVRPICHVNNLFYFNVLRVSWWIRRQPPNLHLARLHHELDLPPGRTPAMEALQRTASRARSAAPPILCLLAEPLPPPNPFQRARAHGRRRRRFRRFYCRCCWGSAWTAPVPSRGAHRCRCGKIGEQPPRRLARCTFRQVNPLAGVARAPAATSTPVISTW